MTAVEIYAPPIYGVLVVERYLRSEQRDLLRRELLDAIGDDRWPLVLDGVRSYWISLAASEPDEAMSRAVETIARQDQEIAALREALAELAREGRR